MQFRGFVANISSRKAGRGMAYSFRLETEKGEDWEYDGKTWIGFGFEKPPFAEGDFIEGECEVNEKGYLQYIKGSGRQVKNPPARARAKNSDAVSNGSAASTPRMASEAEPTGVADRQTQIVLQHSQEMAIAAVGVLLQHDALPMSEAKNKAGTAKRFAEISAMIDKMTRKYYDDVVTGQLLTVVAPELISTEPDGQIPPPATQQPKRVKVSTEEDAGSGKPFEAETAGVF